MLKNKSDYLDQAIHFLKRGTERKLQVHGTEEAEHYLRQADGIADKYDLPHPWPQLISYRLAHVLLRRAKSHEDLDEIKQLLTIASEANCLGPLPLFYRLAVLSRLGRGAEAMKPIFKEIIARLDRYIQASEETMDYDPEENWHDPFEHLTAMQHNIFNMAELAAYFTGFPYTGFEGRGLIDIQMNLPGEHKNDLYYDLYCDLERWQVAGTAQGLAQAAYPKAIALSELEARMARGDFKPPCITFIFSKDRTIHQWNINLEKENAEYKWKKINTNSGVLKFLAVYFLLQDPRKRSTMQLRLFGSDTRETNNNLAQQQGRCADKIVDALKTHRGQFDYKLFAPDEIFRREESISGYMAEIHPHISINGAIDTSVLY